MKFEFEFEDESSKNSLEFNFDEEVDEKVNIYMENEIPVLYANKQAYLALAKIFIKLALGKYSSGFHFHLRQNFEADKKEIIRFHIAK